MSDHVLILTLRSVPTQNDILVPETLLKKRKSQEKARAERAAEQDKRKQVGPLLLLSVIMGRYDAQQHLATRPTSMLLLNLYHLSGLIEFFENALRDVSGNSESFADTIHRPTRRSAASSSSVLRSTSRSTVMLSVRGSALRALPSRMAPSTSRLRPS
jgi:hypothetical protein